MAHSQLSVVEADVQNDRKPTKQYVLNWERLTLTIMYITLYKLIINSSKSRNYRPNNMH